jgi:hypothetical protein
MKGVRLTDMMQRIITDHTEPDAAAGWVALPGIPESVAVSRRFATRGSW